MNQRSRRMRPVVVVGASGVLAATLTYAVNPVSVGFLPPCPLNSVFGVDCPLCGGMRGTHALLNGDVEAAADHNIALLVILPLLVAAFFGWASRRWRGNEHEPRRIPRIELNWIVVPVLVALAVFGVVRNFVPYLGSGGAL